MTTLLGTMRTATDTLTAEHRRIREVLSVLEHACDTLQKGGAIPPTLLPTCVEYFRNFVEQCHDRREEKYLFPLLLQHGRGAADAAVDEMTREHRLAHQRLMVLDQAVSLMDANRTVAAAREYIGLMREHFLKEDYTHFPLVNRVLCPRDQEDLARTFGALQRAEEDDGIRGRYEATLRDLVAEEGIL